MFHILGTGSIGCLIGSQLRKSGSAVTLLFRNNDTLKLFQKDPLIKIKSYNQLVELRGFGAESLEDQPTTGFENLIVTTKAHQVKEALKSVEKRIACSTNIVLLQNGLGVVDSILEAHYNDSALFASQSPIFVVGTTTHGCYRSDSNPFEIIYLSPGQIWLSLIDKHFHPLLPHRPSSEDLATLWESFEKSDLQVSTRISSGELANMLMFKLAVNVCINPLAALKQYKNGDLLHDSDSLLSISKLCHELAAVNHHIFSKIEKQASLLNPVLLENNILETIKKVKENRCSMLQDLEACRKTEIDYINGYIINQARLAGIKTPTIEKYFDLIKEAELKFGK